MADRTLKTLLVTEDTANGALRLRSIAKFYYPLALTSILSLGVHPFITSSWAGAIWLSNRSPYCRGKLAVFIFRALVCLSRKLLLPL
jgi:hypothetical protein